MNRIAFIFLFIIFKAEAQTSVLNLADSLYINGNYSKAIQNYKLHENQAEVYNKIAKAYIAIGNYGAALKNYELYIKINPEDALIKYNFAKLLAKTKKYKTALKVFNDLVSIDSKNPDYQYELGLVLEKLKDSTAVNRFYSAYQLDQTHQKAIYRIAKYNLQKRKYDTADKFIDIGLKSYENNLELISLKAQNLYWKQDYREATKWFERLITLGESSEFIYEKLSICYGKHYNYKKVLENRLKVLEFSPNDATSMYVIGVCYYELNDFINAEKFIKQSLALRDLPLGEEYSKLGTVLNRQKKYDEAITILKKAIKEAPENISAHYKLLLAKDAYYADLDSRIKIHEAFIKQFPSKGFYSESVIKKITELKKEKFIKEGLKEE